MRYWLDVLSRTSTRSWLIDDDDLASVDDGLMMIEHNRPDD